MQEDVTFKVKVESGGFMATQMAIRKQITKASESPVGISDERLIKFKKAFEAKWLKAQLAKNQNQKTEGLNA
jgi:ribosomal protein S9